VPESWDLTDITCDDPDSQSPSFGDPKARTVTFGIDPEEVVTCTFKVGKGRATIAVITEPADATQGFFVGIDPLPGELASVTRYVTSRSPWMSKRRPGTHTARLQIDGDSRWKLTEVDCDDFFSENSSEGDIAARTATLAIDPGEHVTCIFRLQDPTIPKAGRWTVREVGNKVRCKFPFKLEKSDPETGRLRVLDGGERISGSGFTAGQSGRVILGRRAGSTEVGHYRGNKGNAKIEWQVFSPEYMQGTNTVKIRRRGANLHAHARLRHATRGRPGALGTLVDCGHHQSP
jgi:hypothetical protein